ncbi:Amino acid permease [Bacillus thuringiensis serovar sotto str. T04001]|nr:Amino acid permease [Bacillus thuringiensis serovar sotto str. T04001]RNG27378.1 amino acid permease [Bacillus thuringiensis]
MNPKGWMQIKSIIGLIMIALAVSGTLLQKTTRFGFLVSLLFLGIVIIVTIIVHFVSRKRNPAI